MSSVYFAPPRRIASSPTASPLPPWKRSFDLICCLLALPAILAVTVLVATWIKLVSPGPVLFRQERVGYKGRRFALYKFRTMRVDADGASHRAHFAALVQTRRPMQKLDAARDARLIPGGWLLRASGADELPQFINILRREMSLIGPRPCIPYEYDHYTAWHRLRLGSVPGLTGLWQVSGKNRTTFDEMVRLDIRYSRTKSIGLDLKIVGLTLPALLTQIADTRCARRRKSREVAALAVSPSSAHPLAPVAVSTPMMPAAPLHE